MRHRLSRALVTTLFAVLFAAAIPGQYTGSGGPRTSSGGAGEEPRCMGGVATAGAEQLTIVQVDADADAVDAAFNPDGTTRTLFKPSSPTYWGRQPGNAPWTPK